MRAYAHGGWAHQQRFRITFLTVKKPSIFFLVFLTGFELGSLKSKNLESDALPIEPPDTLGYILGYDFVGNKQKVLEEPARSDLHLLL